MFSVSRITDSKKRQGSRLSGTDPQKRPLNRVEGVFLGDQERKTGWTGLPPKQGVERTQCKLHLPQLLLAMCIFAHTWAGENRTGILVVFSRLILVTSSYLAGFTTTSAAACHIPINNTLNAQQMASADGWVESGD